MLGIIIGVAAVIAMVAIGSGAQQRVDEQIDALGSNMLMIIARAAATGGVRVGRRHGHAAHRGRRRGHRAEVARASRRSRRRSAGTAR